MLCFTIFYTIVRAKTQEAWHTKPTPDDETLTSRIGRGRGCPRGIGWVKEAILYRGHATEAATVNKIVYFIGDYQIEDTSLFNKVHLIPLCFRVFGLSLGSFGGYSL